MNANGVTPITEDQWDEITYPYHKLKLGGFPTTEESILSGMATFTVCDVNFVVDPDVEVVGESPIWLVGDLPASMKSVTGMSGGPIIGFDKVGEDTYAMYLVAVQSLQGPGEVPRKVYATPIKSFGPKMVELVKKMLEKPEDGA